MESVWLCGFLGAGVVQLCNSPHGRAELACVCVGTS